MKLEFRPHGQAAMIMHLPDALQLLARGRGFMVVAPSDAVRVLKVPAGTAIYTDTPVQVALPLVDDIRQYTTIHNQRPDAQFTRVSSCEAFVAQPEFDHPPRYGCFLVGPVYVGFSGTLKWVEMPVEWFD